MAASIFDGWAPIMSSVAIKTGTKGRFEVALDGREVFSKAKLNRFPNEGEVEKLLEESLGPRLFWK